jgi:hypothetical protein
VLVLLPYAIWFVQHSVDISEVVQRRLVRTDESHVRRALIGLKSLAANVPAFLAPWFVVVGGLWWAGRSGRPTAQPAGSGEAVLRDTTLVALGVTLTGIVAVGVTHFTVPYLNFILVPVFPFAAAALARSGPRDGAQLLAAVALAAMVVLTCARVYVLGIGGTSADRSFGPHFPYAGLARAIEERGLAHGTLVAFSARDAGNLRAHLPKAEVLWQGSDLRAALKRHVSRRASCAAIEEAGGAVLPAANNPRETIEVPWQATLRGKPRTMQWVLIRLDPADAICTED